MAKTYTTHSGVIQTYVVDDTDENNLCIFERQILRKIFGPVNSDNIRKIRNKMEIN
jgi:hypothetical protein